MSTDPTPRRGRRDNGLHAASFIPLADVDPRVGEHLLDLLGLAGVPAYLEPSADMEPYTRALALPSPPTDRLWVGREQRAAAREIVQAEAEAIRASEHGSATPAAELTPEPRPADESPSRGLDQDEERVWQELIASYRSELVTPVPPWPASEDTDDTDDTDRQVPTGGAPGPGAAPKTDRPDPGRTDRAQPPTADQTDGANQTEDAGGDTGAGAAASGSADPSTTGSGSRWGRRGAGEPGWAGGRPDRHGATAHGEDEDHYLPPPPPPVPRLSRPAMLGIGLVALGAVLLFAPGLVGVDPASGLTFGVLCVLGGAATLILRLRDARSDDGPDDGAVV